MNLSKINKLNFSNKINGPASGLSLMATPKVLALTLNEDVKLFALMKSAKIVGSEQQLIGLLFNLEL
jgi:hypothetical protein